MTSSYVLRSTLLLPLALGALHCAPSSHETLGHAQSAIVGGESDTADPAVVLVAMKTSDGGGTCTGVVVSPHVIVTAAHCLDPRVAGKDLQPYYVYLGTDLGSKEQLAVKSNYVPIAETHFDPDFNASTKSPAHDIGVVITETPLAMTPLPLNREALNADTVGSSVRMVGYGVSDNSASADPNAQSSKHDVSVKVGGVDGEHLSFDDPSHTLCDGDSGGPSLSKRADGSEVVVGIHSYSHLGCTGTAYDTRVDVYATSYIDAFIQKNDPGFVIDTPADDPAAGDADAGAPTTPTAGGSAPAKTSDGCTVTRSSNASPTALLLVLAAVGLARARRRRQGAGQIFCR